MKALTTIMALSIAIGILEAQPLPPGTLDASFDPGTGLEHAPQFFQGIRVKPLPDGSILVGGDFLSYNGHPQGSFLKLMEDGSLDPEFNSNNIVSGIVRDIAWRESDGKILLAGITNLAPGTSSGGMAVVNADGSVDDTFNTGSGFTDNNITVTAVAFQGDKYLVGGRFYNYRGVPRRFFTRLNADGSPDASFSQPFNNYLDGVVRKILVLPNNDFVVIGSMGFDSFETDKRIWYFNADGTLDQSITNTMNGFIGGALDIHLLDNGQLLMMITSNTYNGNSVNHIFRMDSDGTYDPGFTSGLVNLTQGGFQGTILSRMAVQGDGKIVVVGYFTEVDGTAYNSVVRLNANGSIDLGWNSGGGFNYPSTDVAMSYDEKIYVSGEFWEYAGVPRSGIVRIHSDETDAGLSAIGGVEFQDPVLYPNPASTHVNIEGGQRISSVRIFDLSGKTIKVIQPMTTESNTVQRISMESLNPGIYLLELGTPNGALATKRLVVGF